MGARGPAPKRSTQRRRTNDNAQVEQVAVEPDQVYGTPLAGRHSAAGKRFYEALRTSGQAQFYEPSDWAYAEIVVMAIDAYAKRPSAMMLASLNSAMSSLLVTEGDRRRVRLELERPAPDTSAAEADAAVVRLDGYRTRFAG